MRRNFTLDTLTQLKDAGLVAASAAATVATVAKVLDLGEGFVEGNIVADVSAIEIGHNDEIFDIVVQLTNTAAFADDTKIFDKSSLTLSTAGAQRTDANAVNVVGRYVIPVNNEHAGVLYRYMRLYTLAAGTVAVGINYTAYLCKEMP